MSREDKKEKNRQKILSVLAEGKNLLNGIQICEILHEQGLEISERSVRVYLNQLEEEDLIESFGKKGRRITERGLKEINGSLLMGRVGYMSTKIDRLTYQMTFDLALRRGSVVINTALVNRKDMESRLDKINQVFEQGYAMGTQVALLHPGQTQGDLTIPHGMIGFCTVCSVTLNGVLLKHGIPTRSLFSGLLDLEDTHAVRFSELINYDGTSIDPLQLFIRARMTDYVGAITNGCGRIGAGFREIPEESYELALSLADKLQSIGLGAFMKIGRPSQEILNIPVNKGSCGVIVIGGLNPVAILEETKVDVQHFALSGLMEYNQLFHFSELKNRL